MEIPPNKILGPNGRPFETDVADTPATRAMAMVKSFGGLTNFFESLASLTWDPQLRAKDPFKNHAWVYVAAMAKAINIAQAPFQVVMETEVEVAKRREAVIRSGQPWTGVKAGSRRKAILRHLHNPLRHKGLKPKGVEPLTDHPLNDVFLRPNPMFTSPSFLWLSTSLWLSMRGECFWVLLSEDGTPLRPGAIPAEIWPQSPDAFSPIWRDNKLVGWNYRVGKGVGLGSTSKVMPLSLNEVVQFKYYNPNDPTRGFSPISAAASSIELDMLTARHNRSTLMNGANPGGVLVDKSQGGLFATRAQREEYAASFDQEFAGVENNRKTVLLEKGLEYMRLGLSPADMEYIESKRWSREEIFAILRVPKSVASITDDINRSIQESQDKNFWDKGLLPDMHLMEDTVDGTLLYPETDDVMAMFDLTGIQALKWGVKDQIDAAKGMTAADLHAPPRIAFETVGLDVEDYPGIDECLVTPMLSTVDTVIEMSQVPPETSPANPGPDPAQPDPAKDKSSDVRRGLASLIKQQRNTRYLVTFDTGVQKPSEASFSKNWRSWVDEEQRLQLQKFDIWASANGLKTFSATLKDVPENLDAMFVELSDLIQRLKLRSDPSYLLNAEKTWEFTTELDLAGIPVFELDDPIVVKYLKERQKVLLGSAPKTMQERLRKSMVEGFKAGETMSQMRARVGAVYKLERSHYQTLMVARTETGGMMNGLRNAMFDEKGFSVEEWLTALDENVRKSHQVYGEAGPQKRGFNFLELSPDPEPGRLEFPHDPQAPAGEVISCRCMKRPVS